MVPRTKQRQVKAKEDEAMTEKKRQVMNVQRNVVEANMTPQQARYSNDKRRNRNMGNFFSRRTPTQPMISQGTSSCDMR
jgi:hypothetical protein